MDNHVSRLIGAYLDGELGEERRERVEAHLASCASCRRELENTRQLSLWLQSASLPEGLLTAANFAARLEASLPERTVGRGVAPHWTTPGLVWWLIPLGILSGWLAAQFVILLPEWSQVLLPLGISNAALAWVAPGSFLSLWINLISGSLPPELGEGVIAMLEFNALWQATLLQLGLNAVAALLFMSWLAGLAARRMHLAGQPKESNR